MDKYLSINNSIELKFSDSGYYALDLNNSDLNIDYHFDNGDYNLLVFNSNSNDTNLIENMKLDNASVNITFVDLVNHRLNQKTNVDLSLNSSINILTTYLGINDKKIDYEITHREGQSNSLITNNVVVLNEASFEMVIDGIINSGSSFSSCHQKSHCLTIEKPKKAKVLPILKIDENNVEASHSLSCGTVDEEVMFYMNSRGMDKESSKKLILQSYLLPNEDLFSNFENSDLFIRKAQDLVNNYV